MGPEGAEDARTRPTNPVNGSNNNSNHSHNNDNTPTITTDTSALQLRRNLGLISGISYTAGGIIGVGIFVSPQVVLLNTGQSVGVALCVWLFCALLALTGALCYAELGTRIRKSGGTYTYVREAFGDWVGFVFLWSQLVVVRPMAIALGALSAAEYTLRPVFLYCPHLTPLPAKLMLGLCIIWLLVFLNSYSTGCGAIIQTVSTVCKVSALIVVIIIGITFLIKNGVSEELRDPFSSSDLSVRGITFAIYSCSYAYVGWDNLNAATEEVKNPQRNIPLAILFAVVLTAVVYLLTIVSYHVVLTTPQIVSGVAVAAVFVKATFPPLTWVIVPCIATSAAGIVNCIIFCFTRMNFIGGRDGLFPEVLSMVSVSRKTPLVSCLMMGVAAGLMTVMADDISSLLGAYSFFRISGETLAILGMFRLRRKYPATEDTYVAPAVVPVLYLAVNLSLAVVAITRDTSRYIVPLVLTLTGIPIYFLSKSRMFSQGPLRSINDFFVNISRKLLLCDFATKAY
ncbi:hypothetical protein ACOMHN_025324 [Nucella lapillus]